MDTSTNPKIYRGKFWYTSLNNRLWPKIAVFAATLSPPGAGP